MLTSGVSRAEIDYLETPAGTGLKFDSAAPPRLAQVSVVSIGEPASLSVTPHIGGAGTITVVAASKRATASLLFGPMELYASGSITCIEKNHLVDGETVTIDDGSNPPIVYEWDTFGDGVESGNVQVDVSGLATDVEVATEFARVISIQNGLGNGVSATNNFDGTITLAGLADESANVAITHTVADAGFSVQGMSGGRAGLGLGTQVTFLNANDDIELGLELLLSGGTPSSGDYTALTVAGDETGEELAALIAGAVNDLTGELGGQGETFYWQAEASAETVSLVYTLDGASASDGNDHAIETNTLAHLDIALNADGADGIGSADYFTLDGDQLFQYKFPYSSVTAGRAAIEVTEGMTASQVRGATVSTVNARADGLAATQSETPAVIDLAMTTAVAGGTNSENVAAAGFLIDGMTATGGTTASYRVAVKLPDGTVLKACAAAETTGGAPDLDATHFNRIAWDAVTGASSYIVYKGGYQLAETRNTTYDDVGGHVNHTSIPSETNPSGTAEVYGLSFVGGYRPGLVVQSLTTEQRTGIDELYLDQGAIVYDGDLNKYFGYLNTGWSAFAMADNVVTLQAATPGSAQTGNLNVSGTVRAGTALQAGWGTLTGAVPGIVQAGTASAFDSLQAGNITAVNLPAPTITSVTPQTAGGGKTAAYKVVPYLADGTHGAASAAASTADAADDLTAPGSGNTVVTPVVPGATTYAWYRTAFTGTTPAGGAATGYIGSTTGVSILDNGIAGNGAAPPSTDTTGLITGREIVGALTGNASGTAGGLSGSPAIAVASVDTPLLDPTGNLVEQRNGTAGQKYSLYKTYTSSTNYERIFLDAGTDPLAYQIGSEYGSTGGSPRQLVFGGGSVTSDVAPEKRQVLGKSAWSQAASNRTGGDLVLAGGIGSRFFTVVSNTALATKTVTLTANGTLVTLTASAGAPGANQFGPIGSDDTAPQLLVTSTALAAAINAHATLSTLMTATPSAAAVYLDKKTTLSTLTIATGTAGALVTATSGDDGKALLPDGTAALPSQGFLSEPGLGIHHYAAATWGIVSGGLNIFRVSSSVARFRTSNLTLADGNVTVSVPSVGVFQLGAADAASPIAQTLQVQSVNAGVTSNVAGAKFTVTGSLGTGSASGGDISVGTGVTTGTAGSGANTRATRIYEVAAPKALTSGAAAVGVFEIAIPTDNSAVNYEISYCVSIADGTNANVLHGIAFGSAYRATGGTVTAFAPNNDTMTSDATSGTTASGSWSAEAGTGKVTLKYNCEKGNGVGTVTLCEVSYQVKLNGRHSSVTPV